ncbi:MAG: hypothetical protein ACRDHI_02920 [Actinomycetota bacterium]
MIQPIRLALVAGLTLSLLGVGIGPSVAGVPVTVKTRMTGWLSKYHGDYVYRAGATAGLEVGVWPNFPGEKVKARLEWRRHGRRWRLLDISRARLNEDARALFQVRRVPDGFRFRIRVAIAATEEHSAGRSIWSAFRAR